MKGTPAMPGARRGVWIGTLCGVMLATAVAVGEEENYLGPSAVVASKDGKTLFVANTDARQVARVDLVSGKVAGRINMPAEPTGMVLSPDGKSLFVTCAAAKSTVVVLEVASGKTTATIAAGHTAMGPAITPDGRQLYVCNRFDNDVSVIDLASGKETARVKAVREPVAAAVTPDGKTVLVANHLANTRTDMFFVDPVAPGLTVIDTQTHATSVIRLPSGSNGLRGLCISPDGKYAYVTHVLSSFELIPTQVDLGWANINSLSVIDVERKALVNTLGLDDLYLGAGNPWGVACTADGKTICVAHAGTHELTVVDAAAAAGTLVQMFISSYVGAIPEDPRLGTDLRLRINLPGKGPRGLAVVGSKVYVAEYFSDSLAVVDLQVERVRDPEDDTHVGGVGLVKGIALGPKPELTTRRRGELLFNDAMICYQQWQSCASCHPDARTDALNWDLMNDGTGNSKSTKSLLLSHRTPPAMAEGVRQSAEVAVRSGLTHILFAVRPEEEAEAIDEYLKSLEPVPSPHLIDGRLSPAARRGKELFESSDVGCTKCHPAPLYTDRRMHDVGTRSTYGFTDRFDTPTLVEVWRTAPYLHDGRHTTIKDLIGKDRHGKTRGRVDELSEQEVDDLVEFVLSL
ncbi:MAG: cell surface protein [Planctomycetes bacterium]|nr:cell surface protein [Planctomycetota bacterium]